MAPLPSNGAGSPGVVAPIASSAAKRAAARSRASPAIGEALRRTRAGRGSDARPDAATELAGSDKRVGLPARARPLAGAPSQSAFPLHANPRFANSPVARRHAPTPLEPISSACQSADRRSEPMCASARLGEGAPTVLAPSPDRQHRARRRFARHQARVFVASRRRDRVRLRRRPVCECRMTHDEVARSRNAQELVEFAGVSAGACARSAKSPRSQHWSRFPTRRRRLRRIVGQVRTDRRGANKVSRKLADGKVQTCWRAWTCAPRLKENPEARNSSQAQQSCRGSSIIVRGTAPVDHRQFSGERCVFELSHSSRRACSTDLNAIELEFGDKPPTALNDPRVRGDFLEWRDDMADRPRTADYAWTVLAPFHSRRIAGSSQFIFGERGGRRYRADRVDLIWTGCAEREIAAVAGHGHKDAGVRLDRRCLSRRNALWENAIRKPVTGTKLENGWKTSVAKRAAKVRRFSISTSMICQDISMVGAQGLEPWTR